MGGNGKTEIYVSDNPANFESVAKIFLDSDTLPSIHTVEIDKI